jgi:hypothetical protein
MVSVPAVQRPPREAGIELAGGNWKVVQRFSLTLGRGCCWSRRRRLDE